MNDSNDSTYESLRDELSELKSVLEYLKSYRDVTEECLMDISKLFYKQMSSKQVNK